MDRLKIFTDGSLGAETAAINQVDTNAFDNIDNNGNNENSDSIDIQEEPILSIAVDDEERKAEQNKGSSSNSYRGILLHSNSDLTNMVSTAKSHQFRLEIHCIGDRAAEQTLTALENGGCTPEDRPVMTHCQVLNPSIIQRMKQIGAIANVQPSFVPTDMRYFIDLLIY